MEDIPRDDPVAGDRLDFGPRNGPSHRAPVEKAVSAQHDKRPRQHQYPQRYNEPHDQEWNNDGETDDSDRADLRNDRIADEKRNAGHQQAGDNQRDEHRKSFRGVGMGHTVDFA